MRDLCVAFINRSIDDPATREAVTPRYPWGCKRPVLASTFYDALNRPNVQLVPHEVTRVTPTGLVDATGTERRADVLILSTGSSPPGSWRHRGQRARRARYPRRVAGTAQRVPGHHRGGLPELLHPLRAEHQRGVISPSWNGRPRSPRTPSAAWSGARCCGERCLRRTVRSIDTRRKRSAGGGLDRPPARHGPPRRWTPAPQLLPRPRAAERHPVAGNAPWATRWRPACWRGSPAGPRLTQLPGSRDVAPLDGGAQCC